MLNSLLKSLRPSRKPLRRPRRVLLRQLNQLEDRAVPATINWDGGAGNNNWSVAANWDTDTVPGPGDMAVIDTQFSDITITHSGGTSVVGELECWADFELTGGNFDIGSGSEFFGEFKQTGGTLLGSGNFFHTVNWNGGTQGTGTTGIYSEMYISGFPVAAGRRIYTQGLFQGDYRDVYWESGTIFAAAPGNTLTIAGDLVIRGSTDKQINRVTLRREYGTTTWTGTGDLLINNGGAFENMADAVFEVQNDKALETTLVSAGTFGNWGTFRKSAGTGVTSVGLGGLNFNNYGSLEIASGALRIDGGSLDLEPGSITTGRTAGQRWHAERQHATEFD